jgi:hypothetical protein
LRRRRPRDLRASTCPVAILKPISISWGSCSSSQSPASARLPSPSRDASKWRGSRPTAAGTSSRQRAAKRRVRKRGVAFALLRWLAADTEGTAVDSERATTVDGTGGSARVPAGWLPSSSSPSADSGGPLDVNRLCVYEMWGFVCAHSNLLRLWHNSEDRQQQMNKLCPAFSDKS